MGTWPLRVCARSVCGDLSVAGALLSVGAFGVESALHVGACGVCLWQCVVSSPKVEALEGPQPGGEGELCA